MATGRDVTKEVRDQTVKAFEFINVSSDQQINEEDRFTVRTQVMQNYYQKKSHAKCGNNSTPKTGGLRGEHGARRTSARQQIKRFRLLPHGLQDLQPHSTPCRPVKRLEPSSQRFLLQPNHEVSATDVNSNQHAVDDSLTLGSNRWKFQGAEKASSAFQARNSPLDLSEGRLNPMAVLPDGAPPRTRMLIHHYFTDRIRSSSLMMSARKSWLAVGIKDEAFFNSVMSHYAGTYGLASGKGDPIEALLHRIKSIEIVNQRLSQPELRASDGTIGTVASMVTYEANNGTPLAIQTHIDGLERMINLRGGFEKAKFSASLERLIAWAELTTSSVLSTDPRILKFELPGLTLPPYRYPAATRRQITVKSFCPNYAISWNIIDKDVSSIFAELRYLNFILESKDPSEIELTDTMWYSDKTYLVQRSLVFLSLHPQSDDATLDTACCLAASIFVDSCFRDLGLNANAIGIRVSNLRIACEPLLEVRPEESEHEIDHKETLAKLLWVFVFGSIAAVGRPERTWFVKQVAQVLSALEVTTWAETQEILSSILWNSRWEVPRGSLWESVVEERALGQTSAFPNRQ